MLQPSGKRMPAGVHRRLMMRIALKNRARGSDTSLSERTSRSNIAECAKGARTKLTCLCLCTTHPSLDNRYIFELWREIINAHLLLHARSPDGTGIGRDSSLIGWLFGGSTSERIQHINRSRRRFVWSATTRNVSWKGVIKPRYRRNAFSSPSSKCHISTHSGKQTATRSKFSSTWEEQASHSQTAHYTSSHQNHLATEFSPLPQRHTHLQLKSESASYWFLSAHHYSACSNSNIHIYTYTHTHTDRSCTWQSHNCAQSCQARALLLHTLTSPHAPTTFRTSCACKCSKLTGTFFHVCFFLWATVMTSFIFFFRPFSHSRIRSHTHLSPHSHSHFLHPRPHPPSTPQKCW